MSGSVCINISHREPIRIRKASRLNRKQARTDQDVAFGFAAGVLPVNSSDTKEKTLGVRLSLSGVIPRKLVPEQKGPSLF